MPSFLSSGGLDLCLVPVFDKQVLLKSSNPPITEGKPPGSLVFPMYEVYHILSEQTMIKRNKSPQIALRGFAYS